MDFTAKPTTSTAELTADDAQAIYSLIKEYGSADNAYKKQSNSKYDNENFIKVVEEIVEVESCLTAYASDEKNSKASEEDVVAQCTSDLLDCAVLLQDIYTTQGFTFEEWKASFALSDEFI